MSVNVPFAPEDERQISHPLSFGELSPQARSIRVDALATAVSVEAGVRTSVMVPPCSLRRGESRSPVQASRPIATSKIEATRLIVGLLPRIEDEMSLGLATTAQLM